MVRPKWFLPVWLFLGLMCGPGSATAQTNVTGDWDVTVSLPQGPRTAAVSLKQDGDKVTGMVKSRAGELTVEGTIDGSNLRLAFTLNYQGQPLPITITGTVDGPSIAGKADFAGMTEGDFSARRADVTTATEPAAASTSAPASAPLTDTTSSATPAAGAMAGKWDVTFKTQGGEFPVTATLTDEAGKISGTMATQLGELTLEGTIEGKVLKLSTVAKTPQGDIPVALTGDVDGDSIINGKADFGGMGQGEWTAKRSRQ